MHGTCGLNNPWHYLRKMSSWVGNPGRPPYVITRGSAGLKKQAWNGCKLRRRIVMLCEVYLAAAGRPFKLGDGCPMGKAPMWGRLMRIKSHGQDATYLLTHPGNQLGVGSSKRACPRTHGVITLRFILSGSAFGVRKFTIASNAVLQPDQPP